MDSVFNDIEFLMENVKQEPNTNERAGPLAEDIQTADTDTIPTYMTDFILDYINRSLKNEEEETQPEYNEADGADGGSGEESVEDLIARAENMIRENTRLVYPANIPETNTFATTNNEWMQPHNSQPVTSVTNNPSSSGQSTNPSSSNYLTVESGHADVDVIEVGYEAPANTENVISVDTDSDDEVIFVNSNQPPGLRPYEVIDLSDQASPSENLPLSPQRTGSRKRAGGPDIPVPVEHNTTEKQFRHSCAICLDDVKSPHSTTCGHIYCGDCIKNALKIFKKCPTCNKKLKTSNVHPIYL